MNIVFLNPPISPFKKIMRDFDCAGESKSNYLYQPYDFLLMSGLVPLEWHFRFIDAVADKLSHEQVMRELNFEKPDVLVCSVAGINWAEDLQTIKKLRESFQDSKLFTFGDLFIDEHARIEVEPFVDGIFSSPIQFHFKNLLNPRFSINDYEGFYSGKNWPLKNLKAAREFKIPLPRHEHFIKHSYRWPFAKSFRYTTITTAWGCPYSCSYCILNKFPNFWRDYREIIKELLYIKSLGFKEFYMGDKSFGLPLENVMSLLDEMIKLNLNMSWSTYFHPNQFTPKLLSKMKTAGCHTIIIGIETNQFIDLKRYGRHVREDQFQELLDFSKTIGMQICGDFIIGLPHETKKSIEHLIDFSCSLGLDYASFNLATPLPGSSLRQLALDVGKISKKDQHFDSSGHNNIVSMCEISVEELMILHSRAIKKFYLRPSWLIQRLLKIRDIEHLTIQLQEGIELLRSRRST
jgi:hypothetical protein